MSDIRAQHDALCARLRDIPSSRYGERGVWGDGWTVCDLVAHLAEWQFMLLAWHEEGLRGGIPHMPAPGYKWKDTPTLNRAIWLKHRGRSFASVLRDYEAGYTRILDIVEALSADELFIPGTFRWTGNNPLSTYIGANTASHYRFASKVLRRWLTKTNARVRNRPNAGNASSR